jgi:hypothetical protein
VNAVRGLKNRLDLKFYGIEDKLKEQPKVEEVIEPVPE